MLSIPVPEELVADVPLESCAAAEDASWVTGFVVMVSSILF